MADDKKSKIQTTKDYYYILGVRPNAPPQEIQRAYDDLYEKFGPHVSVSGMDPEIMIKTFKDICDAYETLMDSNKRKQYDAATADLRQSSAELRNLWTKHTTGSHQAVSGTHETLQQQRSGTVFPKIGPSQAVSTGAHAPLTTTSQPAADKGAKVQALALETEIEVSLKEAFKGTHRQIKISDPKPCEECAQLKPVNRMQCNNCRGLGYSNVERTEEIDLGPGLFDGQEIRKTGQGRYDMRAGCNGDLILKIKLRPHPVLTVQGKDIQCTVPVTLYEAMLGADIEVPTATGKGTMKIQPLTQPGKVYRLKGFGLAGADQLVTIDVVVPKQLSKEEVVLYRKLKDMCREPNPREAIMQRLQGLS